MEGRPLADRLGPDARVVDLVGGGPGVGIGGEVADAVTRGLDRVQADRGQIVQDVRSVG